MLKSCRCCWLGQALQLRQVDRQLGRQRGLAHAFDLFRKELIDGDAVKGRDLVQPGDRDIAVAAFVGSEQRALQPLIRQDLDLLECQAPLLSQTA